MSQGDVKLSDYLSIMSNCYTVIVKLLLISHGIFASASDKSWAETSDLLLLFPSALKMASVVLGALSPDRDFSGGSVSYLVLQTWNPYIQCIKEITFVF